MIPICGEQLLLCSWAFTALEHLPLNIYRYGPVVIKSVTTVTGDGSLLRLSAAAFLSRSSNTSRLNPITAVLTVELDSGGSGDRFS